MRIHVILCFSFHQGDVFVVENEIDSDWLWVMAQKNQEKGLVPAALVEDAVSNTFIVRIFFFIGKGSCKCNETY